MSPFGSPNVERLREKRNVQGLIKALNYQKMWQVRAEAAEALGELHNQTAVSPLITLLEDTNQTVRIAAISALGKLEDRQAVEPLIALLQLDNTEILEKTALALGNLKDKRAVEPLITLLEFRRDQLYQYFVVQRAAIQALSKLKDPKAFEAFIDLLKIRSERNEIKWVQRTAIEALGASGERNAIDPLIELWKDTHSPSLPPEMRNIGDIQANQLLMKAIEQALGRLGGIEQLLKIIDEKENTEIAVEVLYQILQQSTSEIATEDLRSIFRLGKVFQRIEKPLPAPSATNGKTARPAPRYEEKMIDCSHVKRLAQQELIRRGLTA